MPIYAWREPSKPLYFYLSCLSGSLSLSVCLFTDFCSSVHLSFDLSAHPSVHISLSPEQYLIEHTSLHPYHLVALHSTLHPTPSHVSPAHPCHTKSYTTNQNKHVINFISSNPTNWLRTFLPLSPCFLDFSPFSCLDWAPNPLPGGLDTYSIGFTTLPEHFNEQHQYYLTFSYFFVQSGRLHYLLELTQWRLVFFTRDYKGAIKLSAVFIQRAAVVNLWHLHSLNVGYQMERIQWTQQRKKKHAPIQLIGEQAG